MASKSKFGSQDPLIDKPAGLALSLRRRKQLAESSQITRALDTGRDAVHLHPHNPDQAYHLLQLA